MKVTGINRQFFSRMPILLVLFFLAGPEVYSQTPTHYPTKKEPVDFDLGGILLYIVFPLVLVLAWFLIRRTRKKKKEE